MKLKKGLIIFGVVLTMVAGGAATALASANVLGDPSKPAYAPENTGEYYVPNKLIMTMWAVLPQGQKNFFLQHPGPSAFFPFGIDVDAQAPIGYPSCLAADYGATYEPTKPLPENCVVCQVDDDDDQGDHDNGHGNDDDHDDDSNPGQGGGNHGGGNHGGHGH